jgi:hypothetical protein
MEILVIIGLVIVAAAMFYMSSKNPSKPTSDILPILDANKDGKVDLGDAVYLGDVAVKKTRAAATKATTAVKKTATKAKTAVKKVAAKKAPAKKTAKK